MKTFTLRLLLAPVLGLGLLAAGGCSKSEPAAEGGNVIASNDFESLVGWAPNTESVTREQAHSGVYSVKVDGSVEFGLGYMMTLDKAVDHKPHKIRIEGWGYMTDDKSTARLGFQLLDPAQNKIVFGDPGIDYATDVKTPGKWVKISRDVVLPTDVVSTQQMRIFLWRANASTPAYIDDMRVLEVQ